MAGTKGTRRQQRKEHTIQNAIQQSLVRFTHRFEARLLGLETELHKRFTDAYKELHKALIQERTAHYDTLEIGLRASLENQKQRLQEIHSQITLLRQIQLH